MAKTAKKKSGAKRAARKGGLKKATGRKKVGGQAPVAELKMPWRRLFPKIERGDGCGAAIVVCEKAGAGRERRVTQWEYAVPEIKAASKQGGNRRRGGGGAAIGAATCRALAAMGHEVRTRLMMKLLEGPATYQSLQHATKAKAGPLYHHIDQLRIAGLILPKQRDLYELTRGGRNLILTVAAMGRLVTDRRRRPVSMA